jgi:type I restriction enzyme M protein
VVKLLVEMLEPYRGRVYDPCCGSSGMFVQSVEFIRAHRRGNGNGGKAKADISIYGQESNYTTWRLARMNLAIRGIDGQIRHGDTFHNDQHPDLKADFILANPPFNVSDWRGELLRDDPRWQYGVPPASNANFAWVQHIVHHLAPAGVAGFVLANGSMSSNQSGEGEIRKNLVEADRVDCMVAFPGQLFYSTQIPACLWFLARDRKNGKFRDRRGHVLFIDARKLGRMVDRTHRELTDGEIARIARTYHAWRGEKEAGDFAFRIPDISSQRVISKVLGTLDSRIELDRQMSQTLEAMVRALFTSWFVAFDPVRAKADGRATGLPKSLEGLFPSRLVDSALGEVPEGW